MSAYLASSFPSPAELKGTFQGTLLYLVLYGGVMLPFQSLSKFYLMSKKIKEKKAGEKVDFRAVKYYNRTDHLALVGDRAVGQFVEWSIIFLPLLWMHALFLSDGPSQSWIICLLYTASRAIYPLVFGSNVYPGVLWSAFPNYIILYYMLWRLVYAAMFT